MKGEGWGRPAMAPEDQPAPVSCWRSRHPLVLRRLLTKYLPDHLRAI